jgi:simple sugar transport system ATP-binding protein
MIKNLKEDGKTIIFISHKLDEILDISDYVTVMRKGKKVWTRENKNLTKQILAEAMVGREVLFSAEKEKYEPGQPVLEIKNLTLTSKNNKNIKLLDDVSLEVHSREIVGVAGVSGNGQNELVQVIIGSLSADQGQIFVNNKEISDQTIRERRKKIAYISEDRKNSGSSQENSIVDNSYMTHHYSNKKLNDRGMLLNKKKVNEFTEKIIKNFNVVCSSRNVPISSLSGGNQQKVIVGREFELNNPLLILDQPVRGLDVGSIEYIQKRIVSQRDKGAAILLISADLDEIFNIADRIVVMHKGKIAAIKNPRETTRIEVGEFMLGSKGGGK